MKNQNNRNELTLSIYPKSRGFAYALVENLDTIIDYGVASIKDKSNKTYLKRFRQILDTYRPTVIVLEDYASQKIKKSKRIEKVIDLFKKECHQQALRLYQYKREDIRNVFSKFKAFTKYEISKAIGDWQEELKVFVPNKRKIWESENYYQPVFDSISLIVTYNYLEK